jgi:hypothetical protein
MKHAAMTFGLEIPSSPTKTQRADKALTTIDAQSHR